MHWRVRLLQCFHFMAFGAAIPFFSIYYKKVLLMPDGSPAFTLIGTVFFLQAIAGVVSTPVAGYLADKFKIENRILTLCASSVLLGALLIALPGFGGFSHWSLSRRALLILPGVILNGLFVRPILPLIDTESLNYCHIRYGNPTGYGKIRLFGAFGWIVSACLFGWILSASNLLSVAILGYGGLFGVLAILAASGVRAKIHAVRIPWDHLRNDGMFKKFLLFALVISVALSSSFMFTGYFMDDARIGYLLIGLSLGLGAILEIPVMFYNRQLLERIGNRWMIAGGLLISTAKLALFAALAGRNAAGIIVIAQIALGGVGFALMISGVVNLIDRRAHEDLRATYQNLYHLIFTLGYAFSGLFASFVIKHLGSRWLMGIDGAILLAAVIYFLVVVRGHGPLLADADYKSRPSSG